MTLTGPSARSAPALLAVLLLAATGACASDAPEDDHATEEEAMASANGAPATVAEEGSCYLARGTPEEAAERPSPLDSAAISLGGDEAKVCYGAPSTRGRVIFGELEPWDQPWRAGANEATELHLEFPAELGDITLEPGTYSLYAVPGEERWEIVVSEAIQRWGIPIPTDQDVGRLTVTPEPVEETVETLAWRWEEVSENEAELILEWADTRVRVPVRRTM